MSKQRSRRFDKKNALKFRLTPGGQVPIDLRNGPVEGNQFVLDDEARKEEQLKYGIYYDDDYDYMQHLKSSSEIAQLDLTDINLNARCGEDRDWLFPSSAPGEKMIDEDHDDDSVDDSDISEVDHQLETEDIDMETDGGLDDDFIIQANGGLLPSLDERGLVVANQAGKPRFPKSMEEDDDNESDGDEDDDDVDDMNSYFTRNLQIGASTATNQERTLLDERFAKLLEDYDDDDIGDLGDEEIRGGSLQPDDDLFKQAEEDFLKRQVTKSKPVSAKEPLPLNLYNRAAAQYESDSDESSEEESEHEEFEKVKVAIKPKATQMYNCESILSISSSCMPSHCPRMITESGSSKSKVTSKLSNISNSVLPKSVAPCPIKECSESNEVDSDSSDDGADNKAQPIVRRKGETAEERKLRKAALKERKKERREQKKVLKDVFGREKNAAERELAASSTAVRLV